jgi:hypothetical protein
MTVPCACLHLRRNYLARDAFARSHSEQKIRKRRASGTLHNYITPIADVKCEGGEEQPPLFGCAYASVHTRPRTPPHLRNIDHKHTRDILVGSRAGYRETTVKCKRGELGY